ncbi:MAG: creatininase family protein [Methanomassiliicoccaceae archaeon]|nr:creatininase family protein [Methanomassiliicoccaceae archaeon]MCL2143627.1 creatininase family protein [Methanomassiliicoccaceae archaeon]
MRIDSITADDFKKAVSKNALVILPIGATEAHGAHLPLGTDTFQPEHIAREISERMDNVLIAPALPYGNHSSMKNVPGTISVTFDSLRSVVHDILDSLIWHGVTRILVISGHCGTSHMAAVTEACRAIVMEHDVRIMLISDYEVMRTYDPFCYDGDGHGGLAETSRMLDICPDIVNNERPRGRFVDASGMVLRDASQCMPDGVEGDTADASAVLGEEMNNYITDTVIRMIERDLK